MLLSDIFDFNQEPRFTRVTQGTWLLNKLFLVLIYHRNGYMGTVSWELAGDRRDSAHWYGDEVIAPYDSNLTRPHLEKLLNDPNLTRWEIISNKKAAEILAKTPDNNLQ